MKKICFLFGILMVTFLVSARGQQFSIPNLTIPLIEGTDTLQNAWAGGLNAPMISEIDVDLDSIKDLFVYDRSNDRISVFINDGSTTGKPYHYDYSYASKFPKPYAWALLYDYDCDGREDFFTLSPCECGVAVYRNTTSSGGLQFTLITDTIMEQYLSNLINLYATELAVPAFTDIDNDGDMDILGYNSTTDGRIQYHKNYSEENYGVCDSLNFKFESATWGFFQLQLGGTNNVGCYSCRTSQPQGNGGISVLYNIGDDSELFEQSSAAQRDDSNTSIFAIDLDGDNDKELLVGDISAKNTLMVCNGGTPANALMDSACTDTLYPSYDASIQLNAFTSHAYIDVDNDGKKDLLVTPERTENKQCVWFYKNSGTNSIPLFHLVSTDFLVNTMMDLGEGASPVFFDYNADGYPDLVVGNYGVYDSSNGYFNRGLTLYRNNGTATNPSFTLADTDYAGVRSLLLDGPIYPSFGDLNNDGIDDMVVGSGDGKLYFFIGSGNPVNFTLNQANYFGIDVGNASTPQLVDLNNDGKLDLLIGEQGGFLNYFENNGTFSSPLFTSIPTIDTLGGINVRTTNTVDGYSVPFAYYVTGTQYNLWVSCAKGDVYEYTNITNNLYSTFTLTDTLFHGNQGIRRSYNLAASGTYLDSDAVIDMALGLYGGGIQFYTSINPMGFASLHKSHDKFTLYPNPAVQQVMMKIDGTGIKFPYQADVYNSLGQIIVSEKVFSMNHTFDVSMMQPGLYFMKLTSTQNVMIQKFFVSKR